MVTLQKFQARAGVPVTLLPLLYVSTIYNENLTGVSSVTTERGRGMHGSRPLSTCRMTQEAEYPGKYEDR